MSINIQHKQGTSYNQDVNEHVKLCPHQDVLDLDLDQLKVI